MTLLQIFSLKSHSTTLIAGLQYGALVVSLFILYCFTVYWAKIIIFWLNPFAYLQEKCESLLFFYIDGAYQCILDKIMFNIDAILFFFM